MDSGGRTSTINRNLTMVLHAPARVGEVVGCAWKKELLAPETDGWLVARGGLKLVRALCGIPTYLLLCSHF